MNTAAHPTAARVAVELDGRAHTLPDGTTLAELLAQRGVAPDAVATAVNQRFVPRAARAATVLREGDRITCFEAITGG